MKIIRFPKNWQLSPSHRVLIVSLGGSSGSTRWGQDCIGPLANKIAATWNEERHENVVLAVVGYASPGNMSRRIANNIRRLRTGMIEKSGKKPKLVLIGKSMGATKLYRTITRLDQAKVDIDLFVGVDMSNGLRCHSDAFFRFEGKFGKWEFPDNVKGLVNFYQRKDKLFQCGYIAEWPSHDCKNKGPYNLCLDYNVDVNKDKILVGEQGEIIPGKGEAICTEGNCDHLNIDDSPKLISTIEEIVRKKILLTVDSP